MTLIRLIRAEQLLGYPIVFVVNALIEMMKAISPRFCAWCFSQDYDALHIPGNDEWNDMMLRRLMSDYGYSSDA